jgi:two-component system chemotaxis sensor kinase CheA
MPENEITKKIGKLSEALVFAEPSDLPALSDLHTQFEEIGQWAKENAQSRVEVAASEAAKLIESIILEEVSDAQASLEVIGRVVGAIQNVVCEGVNPEEVEFPEEISQKATAEDAAQKRENDPAADSASGINHPTSLPAHADEAIFADFLARQTEGILEMEAMILELEKSDNDAKLGELRRFIHTLKGESALLGLDDVEKLCHRTEDALGEKPPETLVDVLLSIKDWLGSALDSYSGKGPSPGPIDDLLEMLAGEKSSAAPEKQAEEAPEVEPVTEEVLETKSLGADPSLLGDFVSEALEHLEGADLHLLTLETEPKDEEALNAVFRAFHTIKGVAGFLDLSQIQLLSHEAESLLDLARKGRIILEGPAIDVTFDSVDELKKLVNMVRDCLASGEPLEPNRSIPALVTRIREAAAGKAKPEPSDDSVDCADKKLGQILVESGVASNESV